MASSMAKNKRKWRRSISNIKRNVAMAWQTAAYGNQNDGSWQASTSMSM